jgi:hypothetical protein
MLDMYKNQLQGESAAVLDELIAKGSRPSDHSWYQDSSELAKAKTKVAKSWGPGVKMVLPRLNQLKEEKKRLEEENKELAAEVHAKKRAKTEQPAAPFRSERIAEQSEGKTEPEEKAGPKALFAFGASGKASHVAFFTRVFGKKEVAGFVALVSLSISRLCLSLPCLTADGRSLRSWI